MRAGICRDRWTREVRLVPPELVVYLQQSPVVGWARCVRVVWRR